GTKCSGSFARLEAWGVEAWDLEAKNGHPMTRRHFGVMAAGLFSPFAFDSGCALTREPRESIEGRLTARPLGDVKTTARGTQALGLGSTRDAVLQLPARATDAPLPLIVLLHGAGGQARS